MVCAALEGLSYTNDFLGRRPAAILGIHVTWSDLVDSLQRLGPNCMYVLLGMSIISLELGILLVIPIESS